MSEQEFIDLAEKEAEKLSHQLMDKFIRTFGFEYSGKGFQIGVNNYYDGDKQPITLKLIITLEQGLK